MIVMLCCLFMGCSPSYRVARNLTHASDSLHNHSGFVLYDPIKKKNLVTINGDKYFTPASNTKIFTLYAGLKILGDSVPALRWISRNDSLIFWGTGDPSLLYSEVFQNSRVLMFLQSRPEKLFFSSTNFQDKVYGPGWSWDDYQDYYQAERSPLPLYGNLVTVSHEGIRPSFFQPNTRGKIQLFPGGSSLMPGYALRDKNSNQFFVDPQEINRKLKISIPFITHDSITLQLLSDTLKSNVQQVYDPLPADALTLNSVPIDSIYKPLMQQSDNFIAEQILLMCAQKISDTLKTDIAIKKVKKDFLNDLPDAFEWVDGSGLSRYNQFTPRTIVKLWEKIYELVPRERLFPLLVTNGKAGTLRNMLPNQPTFIYGKTGSLSNNYCLSGYLITKKNRLLIFSSMNTGFVSSTSAIRKNLSKTLQYIYEHY